MRYDAESKIIRITLGEFVSIARRGISPSVSYDEDEPNVSPLVRSKIAKIRGELVESTLTARFIDKANVFELVAKVEGLTQNGVCIARTVSSNPQKPRKSELAEIRGEGYVAAYMLAREKGLESVNISFIYVGESGIDVVEKSETVSRAKLEGFFNKCLVAVSIFATPEVERVTERLPSMKALRFPYGKVREGQSEFVRSAYRTISRGGSLYATAPTGTGKTVSALYPAIRALGDGRVEKVFYLTPKTTTAEAAKDCLELMAEKGGIIRSVILTAKDKICPEGHICRKGARLCPRASFNKIAEAALSLYKLRKTVVGREEIRLIANALSVCPYELSLTYAELCDVVICDFNYLFDPTVYIKRFFTDGGKYAFLIDEAHNLNERAREMYSAELSLSEISAPSAEELLGSFSATKKLSATASKLLSEILFPFVKDELRADKEGRLFGAATISEIPSRLYSLFDEILKVSGEEITINQRASDEEATDRLAFLRAFYYKIKKFADTKASRKRQSLLLLRSPHHTLSMAMK